VNYPRVLDSGLNRFKIQVIYPPNDTHLNMVICFEKPSSGNFICKTRMMQQGVGITSDGRTFGQKNMAEEDFSLKHLDEVDCLVDFGKSVICMAVNGTRVFECFNTSPQLFFSVYLHSVGEGFRLLDLFV